MRTTKDRLGKAELMRIAFLVNLIQNKPKKSQNHPNDFWYELDDSENLPIWEKALVDAGHEVFFVEGNLFLPKKLQEIKPDICFNTCEGYGGDSREAHIPVLLEMLGIPYSAAKPLGMAITLDKPTTKAIFSHNNLPTAKYQVFYSGNEKLDASLKFPLFVKPSREGTGIGTGINSIVNSENELRSQVRILQKNYNQPVLVEEYINGREITVGIVGNLINPYLKIDSDKLLAECGVHVLPILEVDFSGYPTNIGGVFSAEAKIDLAEYFRYKCPAELDAELSSEIQRLAVEAFRVTHCLDICRVDFRIDIDTEKPFILEVNALPGLTNHSDLTTMAKSEGWDQAKLINQILKVAIKRYDLA